MTETKKIDPKSGTLKINDEEIDVTGFNHDPSDNTETPNMTHSGQLTLADDNDELKNTLDNSGTLHIGEWEYDLEDVEIKTQEQIKEERQELHERAPERTKFDEIDGCSDPTDIDELITFLQSAKEQGAEWVCVNDNGREMEPRPQITNSYKEYWQGPKPSECTEYVVL